MASMCILRLLTPFFLLKEFLDSQGRKKQFPTHATSERKPRVAMVDGAYANAELGRGFRGINQSVLSMYSELWDHQAAESDPA